MLLVFPPAQVQAPDPAAKMEALQKAQQWGALCDFFETLSPKQRGENLDAWLQSLQRAERWSRLAEVCDAVIPQLESKSGPRLGIARLERAQALSALNRHAEAEAAHEENGKLGYPDGYANACIEARNGQDWEGLQRNATALVGLNAKNFQALAWQGEALARQKKFVEAEPLLRLALQGDASQSMAWNNLGRCLVAKQAWAEAVQALDTALKLDPNSWEAHYNRGLATFQLGHYEAAVSDLKAAAAAQPGDSQVQKDLASAQSYVHSSVRATRRAKKP